MKEQKDWFQTAELVGVAGLPKTTQGINLKAKNEGWTKRKPEGVKGRAFEYHIDSFPEETQKALRHSSTKNVAEYHDMTKIPFYDVHVSAGHGSVPEEGELSPYSIDIHPQLLLNQGLPIANLFIVPVKGDSMEPSLFDGDLVVLKRVSPPLLVLEGVYLLRIGNELFIKRIQFNKFEAKLRVDSDNSFYDSYTISGEDLNYVEIYGECVLTIGRARRVKLSLPQTDEALA